MALWTYDIRPTAYLEPPAIEPHYAEIVLRGLARMIPAASQLFGRGNDVFVDGGYYCKTPENRPLIGPLPIQGAYIIGALSGFGVMASQGAAELCAAHVAGAALPPYAGSFLLSRYRDSAYQELLKNWDARSGQL
jgi:glycine/D-amino acid oxidase-like deaminating enzyme